MARKWDPKSFAIAVLRRASYRTVARGDVLRAARVERGRYRCAECKSIFGRKEVQVDHIEPVIPVSGWEGFDSFIDRLFCSTEGLQVLCRDKCHREKTLGENKARKANRCKTKK